MTTGVDLSAVPSGTGCADCLDDGGFWIHLRRCTQCGHVACCDTSPAQHASAHAASSGHPIVVSFEPGEDWFWNYTTEQYEELDATRLPPPHERPVEQNPPAPRENIPANWRDLLH